LDQVEEVSVTELSSGKWKLHRFPGCQESVATVSPFDDTSGSNRMSEQSLTILGALKESSFPLKLRTQRAFQFKAQGLELELPFGTSVEGADCKKKIVSETCSGDCVIFGKAGEPVHETLGTAEPYSRDTISFCADELSKKLSGLHLSRDVKQKICESYFWGSLVEAGTMASCSAIRGAVNCDQL
jgi:hypothetical protein